MRPRILLALAVLGGTLVAGVPAAHATPACDSTAFGTGGGSGSVAVTDTYCVKFSALLGELIVITVKRTGGSATVVVGDLYNPSGLYINPMQFFSQTTRDLAYCTALETGTYTLVLGSGNGSGSGSFEYSIDTTTSLASGISTPFLDLEPVDVALSTAVFALNAGLCTHF